MSALDSAGAEAPPPAQAYGEVAGDLPLPPWREIVRHPEFLRGARDTAPVAVGIAAWALVSGVAMTKAGLPLALALLMTWTVFAGSAQLTALPLMLSGAPLWVIWVAAACVNLRFVIFSSFWRPYFAPYGLRQRLTLGYFSGDVNYVLFMKRFPEPRATPEQVPYYGGLVALNWTTWQVFSMLGVVLAHQIPASWGLGFAGVLVLLGLVASMLSGAATWLAAAVAAFAAVATYAAPLRLNIIAAIVAAVAVGMVYESAERAYARQRPAMEPGA